MVSKNTCHRNVNLIIILDMGVKISKKLDSNSYDLDQMEDSQGASCDVSQKISLWSQLMKTAHSPCFPSRSPQWLPHGRDLSPHGRGCLPHGNGLLPQGTLPPPRGQFCSPRGSQVLPHGPMSPPHGRTLKPHGRMFPPHGKRISPQSLSLRALLIRH